MHLAHRVGWVSVLVLLTACASTPKPVPNVDAPRTDTTSTAPPIASAPAPAPAVIADGPRAVRCGVDDAPVDVLSQQGPGPGTPMRDDLSLDDIAKARVGASADRKAELARAQMQAILRQAAVAENAPLDPGHGGLGLDAITRDGQPADPTVLRLRDGQTPQKTVDVTSCKLGQAADGREIALDVQLSAAGAPVIALARGEGLDDAQARCLGEIGCHLSLGDVTQATRLSVRGRFTFTAPTLQPQVTVSARLVSRAEKVRPRALAPWEAAVLPLARACAEKHPPLSSFVTDFDVRLDETGHVGPPRGPTTDAAGAIVDCVGRQLATLEPSLRQVPKGSLVTTTLGFSFEVRFPKDGVGNDVPKARPRH